MSVSQPYVRVLLRFYDIMTKADNSTEEISKVISLPTSKMALEQRVTNDAGRLEIVWHRSSVVPSGFDSWEDLLNYYATYSKNGIADLGKAMTGQVIEVHISSTPFSGTSDYSKMKFWGRVDNFSLRYDNEDNLIVPEYKIIAYDRMKALQDFYRPYKLSAGTLYNQLYTVLTEITNVGLIDSYTSDILNTMTTKTGKGRDVSNFFELLKTICDDANLDWYISSKGVTWLSGWNYRKRHIINSASGAGTNYQVRIKVYYGSGTDSGESVYLNGKCKTDFGDIRFTGSDGSTLLDYWIESKTDSDNAIFWVEIAGDLSSNDQLIYIYYGNSSAASQSSGSNTFVDFDDFTSNTLSSYTQINSGWTIDTSGSGYLKIGLTGEGWISKSKSLTRNYAIMSKFWMSDHDAGIGFIWGSAGGGEASVSGYFANYYPSTTYSELRRYSSGTFTRIASLPTLSPGWYRAEVRATSNTISVVREGVADASVTDTTFTSFNGIGFRQKRSNTYAVDWWALRKYVDPEPSHGSWGNEEETSEVKHELIIKHRIPKRAMYDSDSSYSTALANAEASAITITPSFETEVEWDSSKIINRQIVLGKPCIPYVIRYNDDSKTWIGSGTEEDFTEGIDGVSNSNCPYYWLPRRGVGGSNNIWDSIVKTAGSYSAGFTLENAPDNDDATDWGTISSGDKKKHTARLVTYDPEKFVFDLSSGGNMVFSVRYRILASPDDIFSETSELAVNIRTQFQLRLRCYSKNGGYFQTYVNISGGKYEWFESWYFVQFWSEVKVGFNLFGTNAWESVPNAQGNMPSWAEIIAIEFYPIDPTASAKAASSGNLWIDNLHFTDFQIIGRYDDTESQAKYGIRTTEPMNDYEIPNTTVADFIAQTIVDFYKYPILRCKSPKLPIEDVLANGIDSKLGDYVKVVTENNVRITPLAQIKGIKYESKNNEITCDLEIGDVTIPDVKTTFRTLSLLLKRNMYNIETAKNVLISQGIYGLENAPIALEDLSTSLGLELEMHYIKNNLFTNLDAWTVAYADAIMADNFLSCSKRGNDWSILTHKNEKTFSFNDDLWWRAVLELSGDEILMGYGDLAYYPPSGETGLDYWGLNNFIGFLIRKEGTTYTVYGLCVKNAGIISANKFSDELLNGDKYIKLGENFSNNQAITLMAVTRKISGSDKKIYYYVNDLNVPANTKAVSDLPSNNIKGGNFGFYNLPSSPSSLRLWNCTIAKRWA